MNTKQRLTLASLLLLMGTFAQAALPQEIDGAPMPSLAPLVKRVAPAVVNLRVSQTVDAS